MTIIKFGAAMLLSVLVVACNLVNSPDDAMRPAQQSEAKDGVSGRGSQTANWWDALPRKEWEQYSQIETNSDWFEVYQVADNVFALYEPGQFEEIISFLIVGDEKALLFDTGLGIGNIKNVVSELTRLPVIVVNSHSHYDHIGGNHQFDQIAGIENSYARSRESGATHSQVAEYVQADWLWKQPAGFNPSAYSIKPFNRTITLTPGEKIQLGGRTLEVLHLPGHSPDSLSLLDRANKQLYLGDIFYLAPLYAHLDGSDFSDYRQSAQRLAQLSSGITQVMTAHNVPIVDSDYLNKLHLAFERIAENRPDYSMSDGAREYQFDGFSILTFDQDY